MKLSLHCLQSTTRALLVLFLVSLVSIPAMAQDDDDKKEEDKKDKKDKKAKIEQVEAKVKPLKMYEMLVGKFESTNTGEVEAELEEWSKLEVKKVLEQGTMVKKGDTIVWFETEDFDEGYAAAKLDFVLAELDFKSASLNLEEKKKTYDMDLALKERTWKNEKEDYEYWQKVEWPKQIEELDYDEKTAGYFLEYQKDELDQLMKMYTEDELTEESEAIVLKRAERGVESATRSLDYSMRRLKRNREVNYPRQKIRREESMKRSEIEYEKNKIIFPGTMIRAEIAFDKAKIAFDKKKEKFENLTKDRDMLTLKAPMDGMLFYGECKKGTWSGKRTIEVEDTLPGNKVLFTVVDPSKMMIRVSLKEKSITKVVEGIEGMSIVKGMKKTTIPVRISKIDPIPGDGDTYACEVSLTAAAPKGLLPGMNCKLSFAVYDKPNAVVVPAASVFSDDGYSHYVYVVENEKRVKRTVVVGEKSGDKMEIESGLSAGDKIAKTKEK